MFKGKNLKKFIINASIGAVLGFLYYIFIGCNTGTCNITSNPFISVIYGLVFGILLTIIFSKPTSKEKQK